MLTQSLLQDETRTLVFGTSYEGTTVQERTRHSEELTQTQVPTLRPGVYVTTKRLRVDDGQNFDSNKVGSVAKGTVFSVVEILERPVIDRVRGKVVVPSGWVSLSDMTGEKLFATQVAETVTVVFQLGQLGTAANWETGIVQGIVDGGQGDKLGVQAGF